MCKKTYPDASIPIGEPCDSTGKSLRAEERVSGVIGERGKLRDDVEAADADADCELISGLGIEELLSTAMMASSCSASASARSPVVRMSSSCSERATAAETRAGDGA